MLAPAARPNEQSCSVLDELINSVERGGPQQRLKVLRRVTDLFMAGARGYSEEQIAIFDDIFRQLTTDIESKVRVRLAKKMAALDCAPRGLVRSFAFDDDIDVAAPVLVRSPLLSDDDLIENAKTKSQAHLLAIAERIQLSEGVTDVLVDRGDTRVVRRVARNCGARFSVRGYYQLISRARQDRKLTLALAKRRDLPRECYVRLVESASASVRAALEAAHPQFAGLIEASVDELAAQLQEQARVLSTQHRAAARKLDSFLRNRTVTDADVHAAAHAQDFERAALSLARLGHFGIVVVERALLDHGPDMLLLLAKAAGCSWTTARALLQLREAGRHLTADDLGRCAEQYRKLKDETARNVIRLRECRLRMHTAETPAQVPAADEQPALRIASA
jgi:uncharacterized protein (DUF2336 family)